jgi:hypothetical protein
MARSVVVHSGPPQAVVQQGEPLQNARRRTTINLKRKTREIVMTELSALWLAILLGTVLCFVVSSIIHMAPLWHKNEYPQLPDEEKARAAIGALNVPPGDYMLPRCKSMQEMGAEDFKEKLRQGPKWIITVLPPGDKGMAASLVYWFFFQMLVLVFAAYVSSHALAPGAHYHEVFRYIGATAFMGFALAQLPQSIWYQRAWGTTLALMFDGLIYACVAAGTFGWLWPKALEI